MRSTHPCRYALGVVFLCVFIGASGSVFQVRAEEPGESSAKKQTPVSETHYTDVVRPVLVKYCVECHDPDDESEPVGFLKALTADQVASDRAVWASVAEQLTNRTMPPADEAQPSESERLETATWIKKHLYQTACGQVQYAGAPVPRRLNREQYEYAIEDLTGVEFDFVQTFPSDGGGGEGFNNNGEHLFLPPLLMERYLEVASQILDRVIDVPRFNKTFVPSGERRKSTKDALRLVGKVDAPPRLEADATWLEPGQFASLSVVVYRDDNYRVSTRSMRKGDLPSQAMARLDGKKLSAIKINGKSEASQTINEVRLTKGAHVLSWRVAKDSAPLRILSATIQQIRSVDLDKWEAATKRLFAPGQTNLEPDPRKAAGQIVRAFARRAWRRPISDQELERFVSLFDRGVRRDEPFAQAIKLPLQAVLVSPNFLFVAESGREGVETHPVSDLELASRLALFLWHSLPDETLLKLAVAGKLHQPKELNRQIRRMLADDRSKRFAKSFAGQWLGTRAVGRTVIPDTNFFKPVYTSELVTDLRRQVTETMHLMLRENRPITDWIDADYAVLNRRLAKHYDVEPVPDSNETFERIELTESPRTSILGMGAVHLLTSNSRRTSPVLRGGWVLETVFGVHLPSPPPDAGALPGGAKESKTKTVRERLEEHRANPTCAACHDLIDPIGFAMENFDVLGRWREKEGEHPIDAAGKLPGGETFVGPKELRQVLINRQDEFREQLVRKMLGYALGRSLVDADACTINRIAETLQNNDDTIVSLIEAVVASHPFRFREGTPE